eukprot:7384212-Prymnesium_polylepis.1
MPIGVTSCSCTRQPIQEWWRLPHAAHASQGEAGTRFAARKQETQNCSAAHPSTYTIQALDVAYLQHVADLSNIFWLAGDAVIVEDHALVVPRRSCAAQEEAQHGLL